MIVIQITYKLSSFLLVSLAKHKRLGVIPFSCNIFCDIKPLIFIEDLI